MTEQQRELPPIAAEDLAVTLAVRDDLGPTAEPAVIAEFLDRVGAAIDERVDARVAAARELAQQPPRSSHIQVLSLVFGVPITAIAAGTEGIPGLIVAWTGIAAINLIDRLR